MGSSNVYSNAKIIKEKKDEVQNFQLGSFINNNVNENSIPNESRGKLDDRNINGNVDPVLIELKNLSNELRTIKDKVTILENDGVKGRDIDKQVVQAIKDLKQYAAFFEQASFQLESKILKTSFSLAKKIISIEISENSAQIAQKTINDILSKIKTASKITIHLNPKDFLILKDQLDLEDYIALQEDSNVTPGGVVIASDLGNFDGKIESKINTMLESLESVM